MKLRASLLFYTHIHTNTHTCARARAIISFLRILAATVQCRVIDCTSVTSMRREVVVCNVQKMWKDAFKTPELVTVYLAIMNCADLCERHNLAFANSMSGDCDRANAP